MYEYTPLPNSWESESLSWDHYYNESQLGSSGRMPEAEHERMVLNLTTTLKVMQIEQELEPVTCPLDVYNVYLQHHLEGRDLPCQQSI